MANLDDLAVQKQLLIAQAELERLKFALAAHDVRQVIWPRVDPARSARARSMAARVVNLATPIFGRSRVSAAVRGLSFGLVLLRVLRGFSRRG